MGNKQRAYTEHDHCCEVAEHIIDQIQPKIKEIGEKTAKMCVDLYAHLTLSHDCNTGREVVLYRCAQSVAESNRLSTAPNSMQKFDYRTAWSLCDLAVDMLNDYAECKAVKEEGGRKHE